MFSEEQQDCIPFEEWGFIVTQKSKLREDLRGSLWIPEKSIELAYHFEYIREVFRAGHLKEYWNFSGDELKRFMRKPFTKFKQEEIERIFKLENELQQYGSSVILLSEDSAKNIFSSEGWSHDEKFWFYHLFITM